MIDERLTDLMNQELDGANTADESRELHGRLEADAEARARFDELRRLGEMFRESGEIEPPRGLHAAIVASLAKERSAETRKRALGALAALPARRGRPRVGFAFAAGLVSGACLLAVVLLVTPLWSPVDPGRLRGALVSRDVKRISGEPLIFELPGGAGEARVIDIDGAVEVDVALSSPGPVRVILEHAAGLRYDGIRVPGGAPHAVSVGSRSIEIDHEGDARYVVTFRDAGDDRGAIVFRVVGAGGALFFEQTVRPGQS